ncbi:MAG: hypothetical protein AAF297_09790 [Planctomycetota bacterium]
MSGTAFGQAINFETLPDGVTSPNDELQLPLSAEYEVDGVRVRIGADTTGDAVADTPLLFEAVGGADPGSAFSSSLGADTPAPAFALGLGSWFLKTAPTGALRIVVEYDRDVSAAAGEIWDIDGRADPAFFEQWRARAFTASGGLLDEIVSPPGTDATSPLDGEPWVFVLSGDTIRLVVLEFVGTLPGSAGVAFDNFRATSALPGPLLLTQQPEHLVKDPGGVSDVALFWSEAVRVEPSDVSVVTNDAGAQPVPFTLSGSGTQVTTITFTGTPGGADTGAAVPLRLGSYQIVVSDTALSAAGNVPIDGDASGVAGGEAVLTVRHACEADLRPTDGVLDLADVDAFIAAYVSGCVSP